MHDSFKIKRHDPRIHRLQGYGQAHVATVQFAEVQRRQIHNKPESNEVRLIVCILNSFARCLRAELASADTSPPDESASRARGTRLPEASRLACIHSTLCHCAVMRAL